MKRRDFINQTTLVGSAFFIPGTGIADSLFNDKNSTKKLEIHLFSKHLQFLDYRDMSEAAKEMGFDGIDLTVRPKGHVLPERVIDDLPKATDAMKSFDLIPRMFSSNVIDASNETQKTVLKTAKKLGYEFYRTAWIKYNSGEDILNKVETAIIIQVIMLVPPSGIYIKPWKTSPHLILEVSTTLCMQRLKEEKIGKSDLT